MLMTETNIQPPAFLYNHFRRHANSFFSFDGGLRVGLAGTIRGAERGHAGFAPFRVRRLDFEGGEWLPCLLAPDCELHGYTVQSNRMQERLAAGAGRAATGLRAALHALD